MESASFNLCSICLKMEDMDDFGEIYADMEFQGEAGDSPLPSFQQLHKEAEISTRKSSTEIDSRSIQVDPSAESSISSDEGVCNDPPENGNVSPSNKMLSEVEDDNLVLENGSDSEDDLHIVLNEEHCRADSHSRPMDARKTSERSDDEDDLVIVTESSHLIDRNSMDISLLTDGMVQTNLTHGAQRGNSLKGGYHYRHSQFKYIRPNSTTLQSSRKYGDSSYPCAGRSTLDWEENGIGGQFLSNNARISPSQNGSEFFLPRNRTIFDVGIETFEYKPWRNPEKDIEDFFNFGLDEESWKLYCKNVENFRQQAAHHSWVSSYGSSKPVLDGENGNRCGKLKYAQNIASETSRGDIPSTRESTKKCALPKGRAIQVEGSIVERRPSIDVRRPRNRDSNVIIQIPVNDSMQDPPVSCQDEPGKLPQVAVELSDDRAADMEDQSLDQQSNADLEGGKYSARLSEAQVASASPFQWPNKEDKAHMPAVAAQEKTDKRACENEKKFSSETNNESPSDDQVEHIQSPGHVGGARSDVYRDVPSQMNCRDRSGKTSPHDKVDISEDQYNSSKKEHCSNEAVKKLAANEHSSQAYRKHWSDSDGNSVFNHKIYNKKDKQHAYIFDADDLAHHREKEIMLASHRRRVSQRKSCRSVLLTHSFRTDQDNWRQDGRRCSFKQRHNYMCDRKGCRECHFMGKGHAEQERSRESVTPSKNLYAKRENSMCQKGKRDSEQRETFAEEFNQRICEQSGTYSGRKEFIWEREERNISSSHGKLQNLNQIDRDDYNTYMRFSGHRRHVECYQTPSPKIYDEYCVAKCGGCHDYTPTSGDSYGMWRHERELRHSRPSDPCYMPSRKERNGDCFNSGQKELPYLQLHKTYIDLSGEDREDIYDSERERYNWEAKPACRIDDDWRFMHWDLDQSPRRKESVLLERHLMAYNFDGDGDILDHHFMDRDTLGIDTSHEHKCSKREVALRNRESTDVHLNGWKGKHLQGSHSEVEDSNEPRYHMPYISDREKVVFSHRNTGEDENLLMIRGRHHNDMYPGQLKQVKAVECTSKKRCERHLILQHEDVSALEEGELVESDAILTSTLKKSIMDLNPGFEMLSECNISKKKFQQGECIATEGEVIDCESNRFCEMLAKMEMRRKRFKDPIPIQKVSHESLGLQAFPPPGTSEVKQQRPIRKRLWASG